MLNERNATLNVNAAAKAGTAFEGSKGLTTRYTFEAFDANGNLKWREVFDNLVVTEGLNDSLDKHLKGSGYTASWYIGITATAPTFAPGDTMSSHTGWTEVSAYTEGARPALVLGAVVIGSVDNATNKAVYSINTNSTVIGGGFVVSDGAKGGVAGVLYGGGAFTAGNKQLDDGDTLNVTVTFTATAV